MDASDFDLEDFAFRATLDFRKDASWPSRIWEALAKEAGVRKAVRECYAGDAKREPKVLDGTFVIGANVLATKAPRSWNAQVVSLSFAAFDPKTHAAIGWGGPAWFGGKNAEGQNVLVSVKFLRALLAEGKKLRERPGRIAHDDDVWRVAFSSDGRRLVSMGADHELRIWDAKTNALLARTKLHKFAATFVIGGDHILTGGPDGVLLDAKGKKKAKLRAKGSLEDVAFFSDGKRAAAIGGYDGTYVHVFDLTGKLRAEKNVDVFTSAVAVGPKDRIAVTTEDHELLIFDSSLGLLSRTKLPKSKDISPKCAWTAAGLFAWGDALTRIDEKTGGTTRVRVDGLPLGVSPDGTLALSRTTKGIAIASTSTKSAKSKAKETVVPASTEVAALSPDNRRLAIGEGKTVRIVDL